MKKLYVYAVAFCIYDFEHDMLPELFKHMYKYENDMLPELFKYMHVKVTIESTKTTSMEDVSTGVLEKIKNIFEVQIKPKNDMMYQDIYNCICQNT